MVNLPETKLLNLLRTQTATQTKMQRHKIYIDSPVMVEKPGSHHPFITNSTNLGNVSFKAQA